jgi:16S rRNA (cytosine967-C5)-methyltransferase
VTPAARIDAAIQLLEAVFTDPRPADGVVAAWFRSRRFIGAKDRADVSHRLYRALRHHARLGWWLGRSGHADTARARIIADLMLAEGMAVKDLGRAFDGERYAPAPLTPSEQTLAEHLAGRPLVPPEMPGAVAAECPEWAAAALEAAFGETFAAEMGGLLEPAPLDLRVNTMRSNRDDVARALAAARVRAEPTPISPIGLRIAGRPNLAGLPLFRSGAIEVQDEGSQVVALLVDARPGQQVVDFCAGAGGKALAMGAAMEGRGRVVACDVSEGRLMRARERIKRAGLDNVEPRLLSSERDKWVKRQKGKFDRVLIDAPCSGIGAWRRNPDARWRPVDLAALTAVQSAILDSAGRLVRPGGRLVYATCSLLPAENEIQVARFLDRHAGWEVLDAGAVFAEATGGSLPAAGPMLHLTPARHGTDGFFAAVLVRSAAQAPQEPHLGKEEGSALG